MTTPISKRLFRGAIAGLATLALLTGCAAASEMATDRGERVESEDYQQEYAPDAEGGSEQSEAAPQEPGDDASGDQSDVAERDVITTTSADIRVEDVPGSVSKLEQLVEKYDGRIEARTERTNDEVPEAYLTIRIPAAKNDAFLTELKELGEVMQIESQALDVTLQKVDLESRVSSLQSSIASLEAMLEKATNVEDMLDIEQELSDRQAELQSLEAQLEVLSEDVAMSTVYVNLTTNASPQPIDEPSGFFAGLVEGWNDFVESLNDFVTDFGYALPGLALLVIILALIWFLVIRPIWKRIRAQSRTDQAPAEPTAAPAPNQSAAPSEQTLPPLPPLRSGADAESQQ